MSEFSASDCPPITLYYFDIAGKGEPIRLAAAYGGLSLKDVRLSRAGFEEFREAGFCPFGQLPVLAVGDGDESTYIGQSSAILKYVGKYAGLYPINNPIEAAIVDSLLDQEIDLFCGLSVSRYSSRFGFACLTPENQIAIRMQLNDEVIPRHLGRFEAFLAKAAKSGSGWLAGGANPTVADFMVVPRLEWLIEPGVHDGIDTNILDTFPLLQGLIKRFNELPTNRAYYEKA